VKLSPLECQRLREIVHDLCGLSLGEEKTYLLQHRLEPVARAAGCPSFADFLLKLGGADGPALREPVIEAITTKETSFFRDRHPFDAFRDKILPDLAEVVRRRRSSGNRNPARIWCAAVATGQEAYSLAILIIEYLSSFRGKDLAAADFSILATDISSAALNIARTGHYSDFSIRDVPTSLRDRYFENKKPGWIVRSELTRLIEFRKINLMDDCPGLGMMDCIFCRNVLIYFDDNSRRRICERLADLLTPGGYLVLGAVENLYAVSTRFASEHLGATLVYRKIDLDSACRLIPK
jgi:chemotaxis protein methyltransferase CheR